MAINVPGNVFRRLRFSLRALFIGLTLAAIALGLRVNHVQRQREAVAAIESSGGVVLYTDEGHLSQKRPLSARIWLEEIVGWRKPRYAFVTSKAVGDDFLRNHVREIGSLTELQMTDVSVSDSGLLQLKLLHKLKRLTCIRDMKNERIVNQLESLTMIDFTDVPLPDAIEYLADLHRIRITADEAIPANIMNGRHALTSSQKNVELTDALTSLLGPLDLDWIIRDGSLVVTTRENAKKRRALLDALHHALPNLKNLAID